MKKALPALPLTELHGKQCQAGTMSQDELQRLRLLAEAMQIKAKGEPTIPLAEVKRRIAAKKAADESSANKI